MPTAPDSSTFCVDGEGAMRLDSAARRRPKNTHGTGCTLSSAIAAELAKGASLREAVAAAKAYVTAAIAAADELEIGKGRGPVHHFHAWWAPKLTALTLGHDFHPLLAETRHAQPQLIARLAGTRADCAPCPRRAAFPW